ncbi:MAG: hypothetical protein K8R63_02010 [Bacteroidales bacterium]|nr:hypothetical protein [Bacteroidales bacterium]
MLYRKNLFVAALTFTVFLISIFTNAQKVIVILKQPPPNQWHVEDLWQLTLTNTSQESYNVYLYGTVEEADVGLIFEGTSAPFEVQPYFSGPVSPGDLEPVDVGYTNDDYEEIVMRTGTLPEGTYTICIYVKDYETNEELGSNCIIQPILHPSPPELISPIDETIIENDLPVFIWLPPMPLPLGDMITYNLCIYELLDGQTPIEATEANPIWFEETGIQSTSYQFPIYAREFEQGVTYAWQVTAFDDTEDWMIGKSEVWWFKYSPEIILFKLKLLTPGLAEEIEDPYPLFSWSISDDPGNYSDINYTLKIFETDITSEPINYSVEKPDVMIETQKTFYQYSANDMAFKEGKAYVWWVEAEIDTIDIPIIIVAPAITLIPPDTAHIIFYHVLCYDFGDAPDILGSSPSPYPTFKDPNGARHEWISISYPIEIHIGEAVTTPSCIPKYGWISPSIRAWLGKLPRGYEPPDPPPDGSSECGRRSVDLEYDARTDGSGNPSDNLDDGIYFFPTPAHYCQSCILDSIDVMVNTDTLYNKENNLIFHAWFDWNDDGDWDDEKACGEDNIVYEHIQCTDAKMLWPGSTTTSFDITDSEIIFIPSAWDAKLCAIYRLYFYTWPEPASKIWTRFRLTPNIPDNLSPSYNHFNEYEDQVVSGEVEDYLIQCQPDSYDYGDAPDELDPPNNTHYCSHLLAGSTSVPIFPPRVSPPPRTTLEAAYHENFDYEWLGNIAYGCECLGPSADAEYNGRTINLDNFDNGVNFTDINYIVCDTQTVEVLINVDEDFARLNGRYDSDKLHLHAWFDWNRNGNWDDTWECQEGTPAHDHIYWLTAKPLCDDDVPDPVPVNSHDFEIDPHWWLNELWRGCQIYELTFLAGDTSLSTGNINHVSDTLWCRFRLSYDDGSGINIADTYHGGVEFGEVEDYPLYSQQGTIQCQCTIEKVHINGISVDEGERIDIPRTSPLFPESCDFDITANCGDDCAISYKWTIRKLPGIDYTNTNSAFTYDFSEDGVYTIEITVTCEDETTCSRSFSVKIGSSGTVEPYSPDEPYPPVDTLK